jgi:hypothetical protein
MRLYHTTVYRSPTHTQNYALSPQPPLSGVYAFIKRDARFARLLVLEDGTAQFIRCDSRLRPNSWEEWGKIVR